MPTGTGSVNSMNKYNDKGKNQWQESSQGSDETKVWKINVDLTEHGKIEYINKAL